MRIRGDVLLPVQADGDIIGTTPIEVEVLPGALAVWAPAPRAESLSKGALSHLSVKSGNAVGFDPMAQGGLFP